MNTPLHERKSRRHWLRSTARAAGTLALLPGCSAPPDPLPSCTVAAFSAAVTPPLGHALLAGMIEPARKIIDPLFVKGLVLSPRDQQPIVIAGVDWCEIRNDAYQRWRTVLAKAAGTTPERVVVSSLHQHDAPVFDLEAQRLLDSVSLGGVNCDPEFHEQAVQGVAAAVRKSIALAQPVTHIGLGQAKVEQVASNRRIETPDGRVSFNRSAIAREPEPRALPEGVIDPWLKTLSFWDGDRPVAALSCFAVHPITYYGQGQVSSDYVGQARARRERDAPSVAQVYLTGAAGDVTAGKYNDGNPANRAVLAERVYQAMVGAWEATDRHPLDAVGFRTVPLRLPPRKSAGFTLEDLRRDLEDDSLPPKTRSLAAMGLSWRKRADTGSAIDLPVIDFGPARLLLLPGEAFVEYQLAAQRMRPDLFVVTVGYGDCATGYIPTAKASQEGFDRRRRSIKTWMWVDPDRSEAAMRAALAEAMD